MGDELALPSPAAMAGFGEAQLVEGGIEAIVQREDTEYKSAVVVAKRFPRDEAAAYTAIIKACKRPGMAEKARYAFPRGNKTVTGPSVALAREMARAWGNVRYGLRVVSLDDEQVHIRGYAVDLETNTYVEFEDRFARLVQRKDGNRTIWVSPDERDLRELVNRRGAICVRNALLQVLPSDVTEDAEREAAETVRKAAQGELKQDRAAAIRRLALAFDAIGVNTAMLERRLAHGLDLVTVEETTELRAILTSITEGNSRRQDHFEFDAPRDSGVSEVDARLEAEAPVEPAKPKKQAKPETAGLL